MSESQAFVQKARIFPRKTLCFLLWSLFRWMISNGPTCKRKRWYSMCEWYDVLVDLLLLFEYSVYRNPELYRCTELLHLTLPAATDFTVHLFKGENNHVGGPLDTLVACKRCRRHRILVQRSCQRLPPKRNNSSKFEALAFSGRWQVLNVDLKALRAAIDVIQKQAKLWRTRLRDMMMNTALENQMCYRPALIIYEWV